MGYYSAKKREKVKFELGKFIIISLLFWYCLNIEKGIL